MKTLALLFALSLFLLLNPTHSAFNRIRLPTADVAVPCDGRVLDTDGRELMAGYSYTIASYYMGPSAGEVTMGKSDSSNECPTDVLSTSVDDGTPVRIMPADSNATHVLPSTFQTISFSPIPKMKPCKRSLFWRIQYDADSQQNLLTLGTFDSNLSGRFQIVPILPPLSAYKIIYCMIDTDKCYNVGRLGDPTMGTRRLVLSDDDDAHFVVSFNKN